ncbi:D-serine/D-alanine/glycine:proton symporter, AAT family [Streptoalloteichus tenebrarius]|uniref:D-serine/D-alanine/glycine:proton symporter, AAT family n=1 Tax=Streptoalloteichus tenebrarius (strain ATCC 17920 / DSM 40477 / JCM 4838 / CBS 697.72 / NBRC 16177 / NCIMB 11028 / NRRL B-12390 / A12253. 1 / ISP 5477) TaxID=1933 RepID=A0ABT1HLQ9_STRSD|nr:amino acid permease [Streptoalloteichus tenebrarius]MCP2256447.1 D-serine/D-alanine/glycine:proton symporter, AAT family [Streptoalloteichus tenebrarius]BFF04798.1 amino acid permease [Streptoalloteichus tenebrarius]
MPRAAEPLAAQEASAPAAGPELADGGLKPRHVRMVGLGGALGIGLFLASGKLIQSTGPGLLLAYAVCGVLAYLVLRALGELVVYRPVSGSFTSYAREFLGPWAEFVTGWTYWFTWVVVGMAEVTAVGMYVQVWLPSVPQWCTALLALVAVGTANLVAVRLFGEIEFWAAIVKVLTIVAIILTAVAVAVFGFGAEHSSGVANLWAEGGVLPHGPLAVVLALPLAYASFQGVELVGLTAGETARPQEVLPSVFRSVLWRIALFNIGALAALMVLIPWHRVSASSSPFVQAFDQLGVPAAADIVNFVVLTAALSVCNSGVFGTGRLLMTLGRDGHAPRWLGATNRRGVPARALGVSLAVMLVSVVVNYLVPREAFLYLYSVSVFGGLLTWAVIVATHLRYRAAVAEGRARAVSFRMPGPPWLGRALLGALAVITVLFAAHDETRVALLVGPVWLLLLSGAYLLVRRRQRATEAAASE